ncbi:MAG: DUF2723 domain-containing protein [Chloroflexi bacterium]|nr:DUF2723 domain-containing protein [Chloroflexota bacterium]
MSAWREADGSRAGAAAAPVLVGLVAFALARSVLLPGQGFWDTGEFQAVPPLFGTAHPTGYPTYVILGWLASLVSASLGEPAFRMNLLSAVLLGLAAALVVVLVRSISGRTVVAAAAGLLLALTPIAWRIGAVADPHALHLALMVGLLVLLTGWERRRRTGRPGADRWLAAAAVLFGVMLGNHTLTVLLAPGIAVYLLAVEPGILRRPRLILGCAGLLLGTTALLYLQLPIRAAMEAPLVYGHPDTWQGFWYVVLAEQFRGDLVAPFSDLGRKTADLVSMATAQLGILVALVPAAWALVTIRHPRFALLTTTWLVVTAWFAASYTNAAIDRYYLGPLVVVVAWLGIAGGLVVDAVAGRAVPDEGDKPRAGTVAGLVAGALAAVLIVGPALLAGPATAARVDVSGDRRAADWSRWVLASVPENAVVVSWWSFSTPLWYRTLLLGERPDVWVLDDRDRLDAGLGTVEDVIRSQLPVRPVVVIRTPREIQRLEASWLLDPVVDPNGIQPLYLVVAARGGAGSHSPEEAGTAARSREPRAATMPP